MSACKLLVRSSLSCLECRIILSKNGRLFSTVSLQHLLPPSSSLSLYCRSPLVSPNRGLGFKLKPRGAQSRPYGCIQGAISLETTDSNCSEEIVPQNLTPEPAEEESKDTIEDLIMKNEDVSRFMKMERRNEVPSVGNRWFPYVDRFKAGNMFLSSQEVLEAVDASIMEVRKVRFRNVVNNRSYSVCLVVEGLCDYGNVSAVFRSADALGIQSVHVVSCDSSKRYKDNRHVSMGAEKWLDIELWNSTQECFDVLKSRGYRIATTHVGMETVSIYDMDWSCPTAIVVGNENRGISEEALASSDLHCSIPMKGMVDSFNVSVASGILMHHAVCDRTSRMGCHGDLTSEERQILLAEFSLRHSKSAISIAHEYAKRKNANPVSKL